MKRKGNVGLSFLLILCLCVSMVAGVSLPVSAAAIWTDRSVQQQIFTNTALAYFYKGDAMQYGSYYIASGYRYAGGITRGTPNRSPEDATSEDKLYNVCSAYPHGIYFEAFGEHILTDEMAIPATSQIQDALKNTFYYESSVHTTDFLTGYDLVESAAGWSVNNFDGKNGYGLANSATLCPGNGGNIAIEDWFSQLGPYAGLTSADQKVNPAGEYGVDYFPYDTSLGTTGGFYPGGDRGLLQPGAVAYSQFCVLRPLNSSRFNTGAWQEGSNTTNAQTYDENLYSGTVSADALVVDAIPVHSEFLYEVTAHVTVNWDAMHYWALQYCGFVQVLTPTNLAATIRDDLQTALGSYKEIVDQQK